jgi:hypothetical protein
MVEARFFACDGLENGEEIHGSSAVVPADDLCPLGNHGSG